VHECLYRVGLQIIKNNPVQEYHAPRRDPPLRSRLDTTFRRSTKVAGTPGIELPADELVTNELVDALSKLMGESGAGGEKSSSKGRGRWRRADMRLWRMYFWLLWKL
jgi:hypothetical protein